MTQHFDFVALGWVEKYLREEMDTARSHLYAYQREPDEVRHLREALRNVHSATGVLRLCALDPAALLTQEIERVIGQLIVGKIAGEARKLAMTELAAALEALPAYLANVRAKREVSAGAVANVINDLRHFGNRPSLPDSLFFNPSLKPSAGITQGQQPADDARLRQFGAKAMRICAKFSKPALQRDRDALKQLYAIGKHATPLLAGSQLEPYFRCHMGLIEALAQPWMKSDEVVVDVFKNTFSLLKSLALTGSDALDDVNPMPYIKKMLYYIAKTPSPTALQKGIREAFDIHNVDDVGIASAGRLIQEDDLLEALNDTMSSLLGVMEFMTSQHRDIHSGNSVLVNSIVPQLRQVSLQLKALGLNTHADTISEQHEILKRLSEADAPASQSDLLDFGGALVAVKESLEHKLKHGLSAEGDSMGHDLDSAIMSQTFRCLGDMKNSINREFARQELQTVIVDGDDSGPVTVAQFRPVHRAALVVEDESLQEKVMQWEQNELPPREELVDAAHELLAAIPENAYAEQAAADMEQVVSVLSLMDDKQREANILTLCIQFIRRSIDAGGLVNDAGMSCFAEAIAALEQYMERRTEDPLGNADDHLDRGEARARLLESFIEQRSDMAPAGDNVVPFSPARADDAEEAPADAAAEAAVSPDEEDFAADVDDAQPTAAVSMELEDQEPDSAAVQAVMEAAPEPEQPRVTEAPADGSGVFWRDALQDWAQMTIDRGSDAPQEDPDADIDEELVDCFVEEARKYIRKLQDASPQFADDLENEKYILDIRAVFHTMKGSARTIELYEFGEFMYDLEKVFNAIRDGYISGTPAIAELLASVTERLPVFIDMLMQRIPLYTVDFSVPHQVAAAISEKRFDPVSLQVAMGKLPEAAAEAPAAAASEAEPAEGGSDDIEPEVEQTGEAPWQQPTDDDIVDALAARLRGAQGESSDTPLAGSSLILLNALVPVVKQLSATGIVSLDDAGLSQVLQLPAIESFANNDSVGTVHVRSGAPVACQLIPKCVEGVRRYLNTLAQEDGEAIDPAAHAELERFVREALELPQPVSPITVTGEEGDDQELQDIEFQTEGYGEAGGLASVDLGDIPVTDPPPSDGAMPEEDLVEGDPLSPKLDGASEPDLPLGSESALFEDFDSELGSVDDLDEAELEPAVNYLDLGDDLDALADAQVTDLAEADELSDSAAGLEDTFTADGLEDSAVLDDLEDLMPGLDDGEEASAEPVSDAPAFKSIDLPPLDESDDLVSSALLEQADVDAGTGLTAESSAPVAAEELETSQADVPETLAESESDTLDLGGDEAMVELAEGDDESPADYSADLSEGISEEFSEVLSETFDDLPSLDELSGEAEELPAAAFLDDLEEADAGEQLTDAGEPSALEESLPSLDAEETSVSSIEEFEEQDSEVSPIQSADELEPVAAETGDEQVPSAGGNEDFDAPPEPEVVEVPAVDIDMELLEIFVESLEDAIETIDTAVASLDSDYEASVQKLKNTLHTLKGGANSIGLRNYGTLVHDFETRIVELEHTGDLQSAEGKSEVYAQTDLLHDASDFIKLSQVDWDPDAPATAPASQDESGEEAESDAAAAAALTVVESIRVPTTRIDRLLDVGLEVSMSNVRTRRALDAAQQDRLSVQSLARRVEEIVDKLSLQLDTEIQAKTEAVPAGASFDPLEMDRLTEKQGLAAILREAAFDLHEEAKGLGNQVANAMRETLASARLIESTQSDLRLLRLVSFSRLGPGFRRLVHQTSRQLGKQVEFDLTCDDGGLDVSVFEKLKTALEHMLRNSVDHGVEMPEEREDKGKPAMGKVSLIIYRQAAEFVIRLMDDGKGMAPETLRKKAVERGILGENDRISEHEALQLIFHAGLSTADKVTDISGRGVGMDVVQQSIAQIGGTIDVHSKPGFYTQFDIRVPASIMVNGALLASIGEEEVAVPLTSLDGSDFRHRDVIHAAVTNPSSRLDFRNEEYEVRYLGAVRGTLPVPPLDQMADFLPVLFARYGRRRVAFFADSVTNAEELVIRSLGAQFTGVPGIAGGSLKSDGQPVLALDLNELIRQVDYADSLGDAGDDMDDSRIIVLCVDDSVMMRRTYQKRLASLDYEVVTAEDGEAALDYLAEASRLPDFIFTDLEMPNMNGFDFIQNMRRIPGMERVPTVVVSSRDGEKHRTEAARVGATDFMAKGANTSEGMQKMIQRYLEATAMAS